MGYIDELGELVAKRQQETISISDQIWDFAESRFQEFKSARLQIDYLKSLGFAITEGLGGAETAFVAEAGGGKPIVGFLGEYDALSGLSQEADADCHKPIQEGGDGHGCGHNLLGAGSLAATVAIKEYMEEKNIPGTVRYYGCPAEENAGGKAFMVRDGCFDDCDIVLAWHPGSINCINKSGSLANFRVFFTFHGKSAHAAGSPHLGRSALDAVELMNVGVNYMREHMIDEARVHYAVTNSGGTAPNVVQSEAQVLYAIRAPQVNQVKELYDRVCKIAQGAALMTETEVEIRQVAAYSNYIGNDVIGKQIKDHLTESLPLDYTEEELQYAAKFQKVITELDAKNLKARAKRIAGKDSEKLLAMPIWNFVGPDASGKGSTDVGDVSWVCPTGYCHMATLAAGTPGHAWQAVAQGKGSIAHKGMLLAAKVLAATAYDFLTNPELIQAAREDWLEKLDGETYPNALPKDAKPEIW
ncbi:MAG: amidohydrolase [Clostridia bacterium]|nr:amidohydrolase [Clostridia bacterium]